ncbi:hypothetical protein Bca4012_077084 [Brassica carinata]
MEESPRATLYLSTTVITASCVFSGNTTTAGELLNHQRGSANVCLRSRWRERGETACSTQSYETWWLMERLIEDLQMKGICNIAVFGSPDSRVTRMGSEEWCSYIRFFDGQEVALTWWKKATEQRTAAMRAKNPNPIIREIPAMIRSIAVCTLIHIILLKILRYDKISCLVITRRRRSF